MFITYSIMEVESMRNRDGVTGSGYGDIDPVLGQEGNAEMILGDSFNC